MSESAISGFYQTDPGDYYFQGHFVGFPIMPGVLIIEGLAQLSTIVLRKKIGPNNKNYHFLAYDVKSCQFYKPVFPGEKITLKAEVVGMYEAGNNKIARVSSQALVGEELKSEARFSVAIVDKKDFEKK